MDCPQNEHLDGEIAEVIAQLLEAIAMARLALEEEQVDGDLLESLTQYARDIHDGLQAESDCHARAEFLVGIVKVTDTAIKALEIAGANAVKHDNQ